MSKSVVVFVLLGLIAVSYVSAAKKCYVCKDCEEAKDEKECKDDDMPIVEDNTSTTPTTANPNTDKTTTTEANPNPDKTTTTDANSSSDKTTTDKTTTTVDDDDDDDDHEDDGKRSSGYKKYQQLYKEGDDKTTEAPKDEFRCYTMLFGDGEKTKVQRGCTKQKTCQKADLSGGKDRAECKICTDDLCNSAFSLPSWTLGSLLIVAIIKMLL